MTPVFLLFFAFIFTSFCLYFISQTQAFIFTTQRDLCGQCSFPLKKQDQLPLISWIRLRGRCRYCHTFIPIRYFLQDLVGLLLFASSVYVLGFYSSLLLLCLLLISLYDLQTGRIPNFFLIVCGLLALMSLGLQNVFIAVALYLIGTFVHYLWANPLLGRGDIKFLGMVGLWLSLNELPLFFILAGMGGIFTALCLRSRTIPFAPALSFALGICVLIGKEVDLFENITWIMPILS